MVTCKEIPLSKPHIGKEEETAVINVLRSGWLTQGPNVEAFEKEFAQYVGVKYAVALNSCTSALHLALLAIGAKAGAEVIIPSFTFVATANAVLSTGAVPVFADIDKETFNIDPSDIEKKITHRTKAIIPVHFAGNPCNMTQVMELAGQHDLAIIEDAAEAPGAEYKGRKVGSFRIGCFSFYPTKNMTTGEGGMLTTDDEEIARKVTIMREHGLQKGAWKREAIAKPWERLQVMLGYNYRMTDIQAAIGRCQLRKLDEFNETRRTHAYYLNKHIQDIEEVIPQQVTPASKHVYQIYTARTDGIDRDRLVQELRSRNIGASVHFFPPIHQMPYYREKLFFKETRLPVTEKVAETIFTLPMYPDLTRRELNIIITSVAQAVERLKHVS